MERRAHDFINAYGGQTVFDFEAHLQSNRQMQFDSVFSRIVDIRQNATQIILERIYDGIGFGAIGDDTLRLLAIARVCQPKSKVATVDYLKRCFHEDVKLHKVYRYMDTLYNTQREKIQNISVEHTRGLLGGRIGIVFYDVTTLYFESAREDVLRCPGFSKDGKTSESQIVLGLLVSRDGYPLSY
ncbi:MAG: transposase, partial [Muribaculaceae bacterium]|nr:transposase [Muribaculaceae bacterium]